MKLWLDDVRDPPDKTWTVARTYHEAKILFELHGWPSVVSFDHDLGEDSKSGYDFAKFLVERDLDNSCMPKDFSYNVHSANPVGRENIEKLFANYMKFRWERNDG